MPRPSLTSSSAAVLHLPVLVPRIPLLHRILPRQERVRQTPAQARRRCCATAAVRPIRAVKAHP